MHFKNNTLKFKVLFYDKAALGKLINLIKQFVYFKCKTNFLPK